MTTVEYLVLGLSFTFLGYVAMTKFSLACYKAEKKVWRLVRFKKIHIHHDLGGLIIMFLGLTIQNIIIEIIVTGLGFGVFLNHMLTDGFKFITKY